MEHYEKKISFLGENIQTIRKHRGMKQQELADKIGINMQSLSKIERGVNFPTFDTLEKIMKYDDEKNINFTDYFTVMLKTSIINSNAPIFEENIGKAFNDYSYREIKLRIAFEHKETMLNANRLKMMLPVMSARSIL